jgi:uncharacterized protein (DUF1810 family)
MSLERFRGAQDSPVDGFVDALEEIRSGGKRGHWIWYVFPQLEGLGTSAQARRFALAGEDEAAAYLHDPELRSRLLTITNAVLDAMRSGRAPSLRALMGSEIDAVKVVSSLTLFRHVASALHARHRDDQYAAVARAADDVLAIAAAEGYPPCAYTLARVRS